VHKDHTTTIGPNRAYEVSLWGYRYPATVSNKYGLQRPASSAWPYATNSHFGSRWGLQPSISKQTSARTLAKEAETQYEWKMKLSAAKQCVGKHDKVASNQCWRQYFDSYQGDQGVEAAARAMCKFDESICDADYVESESDKAFDDSRRRKLVIAGPEHHAEHFAAGRQLRNKGRKKLNAEEKEECQKAVGFAKSIASRAANLVKGVAGAIKDLDGTLGAKALATVVGNTPIFGVVDLAVGAMVLTASVVDDLTGDALDLTGTLEEDSLFQGIKDARDWVNENNQVPLPISLKGAANVAKKAGVKVLDDIAEFTAGDLVGDVALAVTNAVNDVYSNGAGASYASNGGGGGSKGTPVISYHSHATTTSHAHNPHSHSPSVAALTETFAAAVVKGASPPTHSHSPHSHTPHAHTPHTHDPHSHNPHGHTPHTHTPKAHSHNPHGHSPHSHNPHGHNPHGHSPHSHGPHSHGKGR